MVNSVIFNDNGLTKITVNIINVYSIVQNRKASHTFIEYLINRRALSGRE